MSPKLNGKSCTPTGNWVLPRNVRVNPFFRLFKTFYYEYIILVLKVLKTVLIPKDKTSNSLPPYKMGLSEGISLYRFGTRSLNPFHISG